MSIDTIVIVAVILVGIGVYIYRSPKARATFDDLRDDFRLNGSNVDHAQIVQAALRGAADVVAAVPVAQPIPTPIALDQVVDQASLDLYRAYLRSANPGLLAYTPTVFTVAAPPTPGPAGWDKPAVFVGGVATTPLVPGTRQIGVGRLGQVLTWPLDPKATRVMVVENLSTPGPAGQYAVKYNLWTSATPNGLATFGDSTTEMVRNAAGLTFPAGSGYVNVRALVVDGVPFYIQAN